MKLIVCNTYSQLLIAIQMMLSVHKNQTVDLWLSDHSLNMDRVVKPLKNIRLFHDIRFIMEKEFVYKRNKVLSIYDAIKYSYGKIQAMHIPLYDEVIFYSLSLRLYALNDYYDKVGHILTWSRMEEGIFSYDTDFESGSRIRLARKLRSFSRRSELADKISNYYCFFPELKENKYGWNLVKIPSIMETKADFIKILSSIFGSKIKTYPQKYMFFASSSDVDGRPYGESDIVLRIAKIVGKENIIIKTHPRDNRKIYSENGLLTYENSWIPWEIIQLMSSYDDRIFITIDSGAFITISAMINSQVRGMFLLDDVRVKDAYLIDRSSTIKSMLDRLHKCNLCLNIQAGNSAELLSKEMSE